MKFITGFKLFRKRKDGTYGPLFINRKQRLVTGVLYPSEDVPTKGYAHRPGWHILEKPVAPHLKETDDRVWCWVYFTPDAVIKRPESQGGVWYLSNKMFILGEVA